MIEITKKLLITEYKKVIASKEAITTIIIV